MSSVSFVRVVSEKPNHGRCGGGKGRGRRLREGYLGSGGGGEEGDGGNWANGRGCLGWI